MYFNTEKKIVLLIITNIIISKYVTYNNIIQKEEFLKIVVDIN